MSAHVQNPPFYRGVTRHMRSTQAVTIRVHLLLLVLVVLLPTAVAAVWITERTYRAEQQLMQRNLQDTTRALSMVVDAELSNRATIARVLADSHLLDAGADASDRALVRFVQEVRRALGAGGGWVQLFEGHQLLLDTRYGERQPVVETTPHSVPVPGVAASNDNAVLSPLRLSGTGDGMFATFSQPVRREGQTLLELRLTLLPQELQRIIDMHAVPPGWVSTILDSRGTVVARHPGAGRHLGRPATADLMKLMAQHAEGPFSSVSLDGVPSLGYFSTSRQGWTYITAIPASQFSQTTPHSARNVAFIALLLMAVAVVAALWVARRIVRPIVGLKTTAAQMQAGRAVEGQITGIAECDDVSAAMADASASMHRARSDLEQQVAAAVSRTRAAEQLASQSRRVEALGRLTGGVAHDFNNVLGIISNSVHLIQRQDSTQSLAAPVQATLRAVEVGSRLTQYLLRFAGRQPVRPKAVDLSRYLLEAQDMLTIVLGKRIQLTLDIDKDLPNIKVDTSELELALINLALNARDALPNGGQVGMKARMAEATETAKLPPGSYAVVAFSDTGEGIADSAIEHVFEPFFTTKASGKGSGLGLSQVLGFCTQAGGTALVSSTPGSGTAVLLILPAADPAKEHDPEPPKPDLSADTTGKRLLLVEDNAELGDATMALLESYGFNVSRATGAEPALAMLQPGHGIDIVLSDVLMPGSMDGLAMARLLREQEPALPVVLISGYSSALTQAHDFIVLQKPSTPSELMGALKWALDTRG